MSDDRTTPAPQPDHDGRELGHWQTRYLDPESQKLIRWEGWYLGCFLGSVLILIPLAFIFLRKPLIGLPENDIESLYLYLLAILGGVLGGTLFSIKWLYHSVAKNKWNIDRRLWRLFTPLISGALSVSVVAMIRSGLLVIMDTQVLNKRSLVYSLAFLVGYFSDSALAKLSEIAFSLFGSKGKFGDNG